MHVDLPEPCIGRCELTLEYSIPVVEPKPDQSTAFTLPLPMPENVRIASHRASIESDRMIRAVANDNRWTVVNREIIADIGRSVVHLSAPRQLDRLDLTLQREGST